MRWSDSDRAELERTIANFNQKLYRVKKRAPDIAEYQPERITPEGAVKLIQEQIRTRADFNRVINSLQRYSRRGAEKVVKSNRGARATEWETKEFAIKQRTENARRAKERKKIEAQPVTVGGKKQDRTRAEMGTIKDNSLKPNRGKFKNMSQKEWEYATRAMDARFNYTELDEMRERMRDNYIKGLTDYGFIDSNPELEDMIRALTPEEFYNMSQTDESADFYFYKDPIAWTARQEMLLKTWGKAYEDHKKREESKP